MGAVIFITCLGVAITVVWADRGSGVVAGKQERYEPELFYPPNTADRITILNLLNNRKYSELNEKLASLQAAFEEDVRNEYILADSFDAFEIPDPSIEPFLNEWIDSFPKHFAPHTARALYRYSRGYKYRGTEWASDTSEEQFRQMHGYFVLAKEDIHKALTINPKILSAHLLLINIARTGGSNWESNAAFEAAMRVKPESMILRSAYMHCLTPRWGGNYRAMARFASESDELMNRNPSLVVLRGYIDWDKGRSLASDGNRDEALKSYNRALSFGTSVLFLEYRATTHYNLKMRDEARKDVERMLAIQPQSLGAIALRGTLRAVDNNFREALDDFRMVESIDREDSDLLRWRKVAASELVRKGYDLRKTDPEKAIEIYSQAILMDPGYSRSFYYRAWNYQAGKDFDNALRDLKEAIRLEPGYYSSYELLDSVLTRQKRWDEIIHYWDQFIALEPSNGKAYLERGGAYYQKGDRVAALRDTKKACESGNPDGCQQFQRLGGH